MGQQVSWQRIGLTTLIFVLVALNVYQYLTPPVIREPRLSRQQTLDLFHQMFYNNRETWLLNRWLGIQAQQNPNDVWIIQEILFEVKPDFVVETGTAFGGSAALWATVLEQVNPRGRVITIDIEDKAGEARKLPIVQRQVDFLLGSSTAPEIIAEVEKRVTGHRVVVILDSNHSKQHVANELQAYAPLVNVGSYLIVQDTNINGHPVYEAYGPGPWEAVDEFLSHNDQFQADRTRERLLFTMHPRGYLQRVQ
jgi:cephalosporin hydroxylase